MEITLEAIISLIGLFVGGGGGAFFMWKYQKRKAKAEAEEAEVDMAQKVQETYERILQAKDKEVEDNHRLIGELRMDRDHYKNDRNELREQVGRMQDEILYMKREIARNGRMVEGLRPFMCGDLSCKMRQRVTISADAEVKGKKGKKGEPHPQPQHEIEPTNED